MYRSPLFQTDVLALQWLLPSTFEQVGWFYSPLMITHSFSTVIMRNPNTMLPFLLYMRSLDLWEFLLFMWRWNFIKISIGSWFVKALFPWLGTKRRNLLYKYKIFSCCILNWKMLIFNYYYDMTCLWISPFLSKLLLRASFGQEYNVVSFKTIPQVGYSCEVLIIHKCLWEFSWN